MNESRVNVMVIMMTFLCSVITLFFFIFPLLEGIKNNSDNLIKNRIMIEQLIVKTETPKNDLEELNIFVEKVNTLYMSSNKPIETILFLREKANKYNIDQEISSIQSSSANEKWPYLNVKLSIYASPNNFFKFIEEIESNELLIKIYELDIKKNENDLLVGNMSLKFFYRE